MRVYLAAGAQPGPMRHAREAGYPWMLCSFAYPQAYALLAGWPLRSLIIDSGAFTAWSAGKAVDFDAYRRHLALVRAGWSALDAAGELHAVNLDVIPGAKGRTSTTDEQERAIALSLARADGLRGDGYRVMEVYHQDEPGDYLDLLVDRRRPGELLGLSPRNDLPRQARIRWLRAIYGRWRAAEAAIPPCHILAGTMRQVWESCPIYSADSTTWLVGHQYGRAVDGTGTQKVWGKVFASTRPQAVKDLATIESIAGYRLVSAAMTALWERRGFPWRGVPW
jgi:hypothetical protein